MLKKISILVCIFWAGFSTAQNWYNINQTNNPQVSISTSISEINDTLYVFGIKFTKSLFGFYQRSIRFCNPSSGETYRQINLSDTIGQIGGTANEHVFINKSFYLLNTRKLDNDTTTSQLQKLDQFGNLIWNMRYDIPFYYSVFRSIISLNDSTLLLCGDKETTFNNVDMRLTWLDTNGIKLNERIYNSPNLQYGYQIEQFTNGDLLLTGGSVINGTDTYKTFYRLAANGDIIWQKNMGGNGWSAGLTALLSDSSIYWTGAFAFPSQTIKPRILKMDANGDTLWSYTLAPFSASQTSIQCSYENVVEAENFSITTLGRYRDTIYNRPTSFLQHLTSEGESKWLRKISIRKSDNYNSSLIRAANGDYIFIGYVGGDLPGEVEDGWLVRTNCIGLFEGPVDSVLISQNEASLSLFNFANHFAFSEVDWGDSSQIEIQESNYSDTLEQITHTHAYLEEGNYSITHKTIACNDTLKKTFSISIVKTPFSNNQLTLFPNPSNGNFTLGLTHLGTAHISIYDNTGKIVYRESTNLNDGKMLNLAHLAAGLYHLVVEVNGEKWKTKLVVE